MPTCLIGPIPSRVMVVGDFPSEQEAYSGTPFTGVSGNLLNELLAFLGFPRPSVAITNVCPFSPPSGDIAEWTSPNIRQPKDCPTWKQVNGLWVEPRIFAGREALLKQIEEVKPEVIIAMGNLALWALTGCQGIMKWRASRLYAPGGQVVFPTYHTANVLRMKEWLPILEADFRRIKRWINGEIKPRNYRFTVSPSFHQVTEILDDLLLRAERANPTSPLKLAGDIETRSKHITCFGVAWSEEDALCIPFIQMKPEQPFYWEEWQEREILYQLYRLFRHPNIQWVGQNYLYDCQYYHRLWGFLPLNVRDTMIGHHSLYANTRKGLDYLSSIYCEDHVYWKDESKNWDPTIGEEQNWRYNCKDVVATFEADSSILAARDRLGLTRHFDFQQSLFFPVLRIINRGVRWDESKRGPLSLELASVSMSRQEQLNLMAGHPLNPNSSQQLLRFFCDDLGIPGVKALGEDRLTTGVVALEQIGNRVPEIRPLLQTIAELRSLKTFRSTFIDARLDDDRRMRTHFVIAGPITYRFASTQNAFDSGMNFQNIPTKEKEKLSFVHDYIRLPNVRKLIVPDPGCTFFDMDLDRADLQVVVWEADDSELKTVLRRGIDMHCYSAVNVYGIKGIPIEELAESHPNYRDHRARIGEDKRQRTKAGVHAVNYVCQPRKLATVLGITIAEAEKFIRGWLGAHPGIERWHRRTEDSARKRGFIENVFGARLHILGGVIDLPELVAWQPQSVVAGVINRALVAIDAEREANRCSVDLLLQVHDSLGGQFPTHRKDESLATLKRLSAIPVPYADPLIIPVGFKTSPISWGDCK